MALFSRNTTKEQKKLDDAVQGAPAARVAKREERVLVETEEVKKPAPKQFARKRLPEHPNAKKPTDKTPGSTLTKAPVHILKRALVTEKALYATVHSCYVFEVAEDATKRDIITVMKALYGVIPRKVSIVRRAPRAYISRARNRRNGGIRPKPQRRQCFVVLCRWRATLCYCTQRHAGG
jgi:ribosomal protein L23